MKLIQAMKQVQDLLRKADDLKQKIAKYCVDLDFETPTYGTPDQQREQVKDWLQAHHDIIKKVEDLRLAITRTNLATMVTMEIGGKQITKPITAWIMRRGVKGSGLAGQEQKAYLALTDKNLKDGQAKVTSGDTIAVKVRRYYDPAERDNKSELYRSEASIVDANLEVTNAITELIEE
jgi:hypothetical protein